MFCGKCGNKMEGRVAFCGNCGNKILPEICEPRVYKGNMAAVQKTIILIASVVGMLSTFLTWHYNDLHKISVSGFKFINTVSFPNFLSNTSLFLYKILYAIMLMPGSVAFMFFIAPFVISIWKKSKPLSLAQRTVSAITGAACFVVGVSISSNISKNVEHHAGFGLYLMILAAVCVFIAALFSIKQANVDATPESETFTQRKIILTASAVGMFSVMFLPWICDPIVSVGIMFGGVQLSYESWFSKALIGALFILLIVSMAVSIAGDRSRPLTLAQRVINAICGLLICAVFGALFIIVSKKLQPLPLSYEYWIDKIGFGLYLMAFAGASVFFASFFSGRQVKSGAATENYIAAQRIIILAASAIGMLSIFMPWLGLVTYQTLNIAVLGYVYWPSVTLLTGALFMFLIVPVAINIAGDRSRPLVLAQGVINAICGLMICVGAGVIFMIIEEPFKKIGLGIYMMVFAVACIFVASFFSTKRAKANIAAKRNVEPPISVKKDIEPQITAKINIEPHIAVESNNEPHIAPKSNVEPQPAYSPQADTKRKTSVKKKTSIVKYIVAAVLVIAVAVGGFFAWEVISGSKSGVAQIQKAAKAGDKEAQYRLGYLYTIGWKGVEADLKKAFEWYEKAAEQGHPDAQWVLGYDVYYAGRYSGAGIPQDYKKAYEWLKKAANQNYIEAQKALGLIYASGQRGVPRDYEKAFEWYQKAAQAGDKSAQKVLSEMYSKGLGVEQDYEKADEWLKIANQ